MADGVDRKWIEAHAIAFALGELEGAEEERFRQSVADDPEYEDFDALRDPQAVGHVPAALIARWDAQGRNLSDTERDLVALHLRACETCREDLDLVRRVAPTGPAGRVVRPASWRPWVGGALIGAAAMLVFMFPTNVELPRVTSGQHVEVISPRAVRGPDTPVYELEADATAFLLAVAVPEDVGNNPGIVLVGPDGAVVVDRPAGPGPFVQILVIADPLFQPGEYDVRLRTASGDRDLGRFIIERPR